MEPQILVGNIHNLLIHTIILLMPCPYYLKNAVKNRRGAEIAESRKIKFF
jgi:hypothetical protein